MNETASTWQHYRPYAFLALALVMGALQVLDIIRDQAGIFDWLLLAGAVFVLVNSAREILARRTPVAG